MAFNAFLVDRWAAVKSGHPTENRRQTRLRLAQEFWSLPREEKIRSEERAIAEQERIRSALESLNDGDEDDCDAPGIGILVRTDFTNDDAWNAFCEALSDAEKDFLADTNHTPDGVVDEDGAAGVDSESESDDGDGDGDVEMQSVTNGQATNGHSSAPPSIFTLVNPDSGSPLYTQITNASNLSVLRLFNDVSIVRALVPPQGTPRVRGNRLIDCEGYVEVYSGNITWVYDAQSNVDRSVRLVSQKGEVYGAATGDSWRPRVSFLPELQINLFTGAIKIDFGGVDRWDFRERQRNIAEAEATLHMS